ncbi:MAG: potassium transporter, partial [Muribaculaceae bacterium]|nr:potassium transporter [Muribaculaceae bacterium]
MTQTKRHTRAHRHIEIGSEILTSAGYVASVVTLVSLIVLVGFDHDDGSRSSIRLVLRFCQGIFAASVAYDLLLNFRTMRRKSTVLRWIVDGAMLVTVAPWLYPHPETPWIDWLDHLLYSHYFLYTVLTAYSVLELSSGLTRLFGKRLNPSLLLGISFMAFTIIGSFVLMMPKCTYHGISYIDSLFVSGSAVCITGLTPVDVATTFTPLGNLVLAILFEVGGLGILTFTCFFALFFSGNQSIYNQMLVRDIVYSKSMKSLVPTLLYILGFTVVIEAIGAVMLYVTTPDSLGMDVESKAAFAVFHSISAFCNAGFSTIEGGMANPELMAGNQTFYIALSALILAGGIGFPILVNVKDALFMRLGRAWRHITRRRPLPRPVHLFDLNTKLVLVTSLTLLAVCTAVFFIVESGNTMKGMPWDKRLIQSVFNSLTPRSAGFVS